MVSHPAGIHLADAIMYQNNAGIYTIAIASEGTEQAWCATLYTDACNGPTEDDIGDAVTEWLRESEALFPLGIDADTPGGSR